MPEHQGGKPGNEARGGYSWGIAGFIVSFAVALVVAFLFMFLTLGGLGGGVGAAYAGMAALFVGGLIFLGTLFFLGLFFLIFFLATGRRKALLVAVGHVVFAGVLIVIFLVYIAS
ncbi:MAG: hypothetical protein JXD23_00515 [Spirochaetales bacterium]|nr:hypothetical protein [Spirochaetales bacterium]